MGEYLNGNSTAVLDWRTRPTTQVSLILREKNSKWGPKTKPMEGSKGWYGLMRQEWNHCKFDW